MGGILHKVAKFGEGIIIHCIYETASTGGGGWDGAALGNKFFRF